MDMDRRIEEENRNSRSFWWKMTVLLCVGMVCLTALEIAYGWKTGDW